MLEPEQPERSAVSRSDLQSKALRGGLASILQAGVSIPVGFVSAVVVARVLGPVDFGTLAFLTLLLAHALPVLDLGFSAALNQFGVQEESTGRRKQTVRLLQSRIGFTLLVPAPALSVGGAYFFRDEPWWIAAGFALVMYVSAFVGAGGEALYLQNRSASIAVLATVTGLLAAVSAVVLVLFTKDPVLIWFARVALTLLLPTAALVLVNREWGWRWMRPRLPRGLPRGFWRFGILAGFGAITSSLVFSRSEIYVFRYHDLLVELGLYALAFGIAQQVLAPLDALLVPLAPAQSAMVYAHPDHALRSLLRSTAIVATMCGGLVALTPLIAFVFPAIFGERFAGAGALFLALVIASSSKTLLGPVTVSFHARRRGLTLALAPAVALIVDLGIAFLAIVPFGVWGAVVANICGQSLVLGVYVRGELRSYEDAGRLLLRACVPWLLGVLAAGAAGLAFLVPAGPLVTPALALALSGTTFICLMRAFGHSSRAELAGVVDALPVALQRPTRLGLRVLGVPAVAGEPATAPPGG